MITAAAQAATSFNILIWVSVGTAILGLITAVVAARSFRTLKRNTPDPEPPQTTLPKLFNQQITHHNQPASQKDEHDRAI